LCQKKLEFSVNVGKERVVMFSLRAPFIVIINNPRYSVGGDGNDV